MAELDDITIGEMGKILTNRIAEERGVNRITARKLPANALEYNVVIAAINEQIDFILEED